MSKLDDVIGVQGNNEYNEGFNAGINFVKTVMDSDEFRQKLFDNIMIQNTESLVSVTINTLKEFNV